METENNNKLVELYYNKFTDHYLKIYGNVIQAFRPKSTKKLLDYIAESSGLKRGDYILDAGCGVCGPAIYFAKKYNIKIAAITISSVQVEKAKETISLQNLTSKISVEEGDYHYLTKQFKQNSFDSIFFLESLGHSQNPTLAIEEAYKVLKPNGFIYIKDFYKKQVDNQDLQLKIDKVIGNINEAYKYATLDLNTVIMALRRQGFEIEFIKKFDFKDDITVRYNFEKELNIDVFEDLEEFWPAEWLEIKCKKV